MDAFLDGLEQAHAAGRDLTRHRRSVASFFVSRVDTEIDQPPATRSARPRRKRCAAWPRSRTPGWPSRPTSEVFTSSRWHALTRAGARPQRPLWASTGVKDPTYADTRYVVDLVASGVVNTMPEATLHAVADHGALRGDTVRGCYDDAASR